MCRSYKISDRKDLAEILRLPEQESIETVGHTRRLPFPSGIGQNRGYNPVDMGPLLDRVVDGVAVPLVESGSPAFRGQEEEEGREGHQDS